MAAFLPSDRKRIPYPESKIDLFRQILSKQVENRARI